MEKAMFGAGCFWGVETAFRKLKGVESATVGYSGGNTKDPSYQDVCTGQTGHTEVVEVDFDPALVSYKELLTLFWEIHDPTTLNRQGPDVGSQYRSAVYFLTEEQRDQALALKEQLQKSGEFHNNVVTEISSASQFYRAEEYHQQYFEKRGISH